MALTRDGADELEPSVRETAEALLREVSLGTARREAATPRTLSGGRSRTQLHLAVELLRLLKLVLEPVVDGDAGEWDGSLDSLASKPGLLAGESGSGTGPTTHPPVLDLPARGRPSARERPVCAPERCVEMRAGAVKLDPETADVSVNGLSVRITPAQFKTLGLLVAAQGRTVRNEAIAREIWGDGGAPSRNVLKLHMKNLRQRLGDSGAESKIIANVRGFGYRINA